MTQVILGKSRVREICMPGSVRAKAKWLSYSTNPLPCHKLESGGRLSSSWTLSGEWESVVDAYQTLSVHRKVGGSMAVVAACRHFRHSLPV